MKMSDRTTGRDRAERDMYEWQSQVTKKCRDKSYDSKNDWNPFWKSLLVRGILLNTIKYRDAKELRSA